MRVYTIPETRLDLFLTALDMNFDLPPPDYIFKRKDHDYDVVYTRRGIKKQLNKVDPFVKEVWTFILSSGASNANKS